MPFDWAADVALHVFGKYNSKPKCISNLKALHLQFIISCYSAKANQIDFYISSQFPKFRFNKVSNSLL